MGRYREPNPWYGSRDSVETLVYHGDTLILDKPQREARYQFRNTTRNVYLLVRIQYRKPDDVLGVFTRECGLYVNIDTGHGYATADDAWQGMKQHKPAKQSKPKTTRNKQVTTRRVVMSTAPEQRVTLKTLVELGY